MHSLVSTAGWRCWLPACRHIRHGVPFSGRHGYVRQQTSPWLSKAFRPSGPAYSTVPAGTESPFPTATMGLPYAEKAELSCHVVCLYRLWGVWNKSVHKNRDVTEPPLQRWAKDNTTQPTEKRCFPSSMKVSSGPVSREYKIFEVPYTCMRVLTYTKAAFIVAILSIFLSSRANKKYE